ncbi:MAG: ATP-binding cassette domain-containing protein [Lachnospiraceae bacterium]|nr:ATP-binding cassette domain-containing protein [Lachnospiraceae bacterium]
MKILDFNPINVIIGKEERIVDGTLQVSSGDVILLTGPNGCGKSTIIKVLIGDVFDYTGLKYKGSSAVFYKSDKEYHILESQSDMELFRNNVCYVSQDDDFESDSLLDCFISSIDRFDISNKEKYVFDFIKGNAAYESFYYGNADVRLNAGAKRIAKRLGLKNTKLDINEKKTLMLMSMNVKKMSGGQRKLANILTNIVRYEFCSLMILDEPLNNLDYRNVRAFSNILTRIYMNKPELGVIMVTHCRSIPIINKVIEINPSEKRLGIGKEYKCNSCFGEINKDGLYV